MLYYGYGCRYRYGWTDGRTNGLAAWQEDLLGKAKRFFGGVFCRRLAGLSGSIETQILGDERRCYLVREVGFSGRLKKDL